MSISSSTQKALHEAGLTEYELRAYVSLLKYGRLTANETSKESDIPYSKIYEVLRNLEKKGWIEIESGRPNKYYPKAPSEAIEATRMRVEHMLSNFEDQVIEELQPIYEKKGIRERPDIWIVRGNFNVIQKIREIIKKTEKELVFAIPIIKHALYKNFNADFIRIGASKIQFRLMTTKPVNEELIDEITKVAETRIRDQMFGGGLISDNKEVVLLLGESGEETLAIWSDHMGLVKLAREYFDYLWNGAVSV
jgi:sugar-specific transcriptional regulator TrmB